MRGRLILECCAALVQTVETRLRCAGRRLCWWSLLAACRSVHSGRHIRQLPSAHQSFTVAALVRHDRITFFTLGSRTWTAREPTNLLAIVATAGLLVSSAAIAASAADYLGYTHGRRSFWRLSGLSFARCVVHTSD